MKNTNTPHNPHQTKQIFSKEAKSAACPQVHTDQNIAISEQKIYTKHLDHLTGHI